MFYVAPLLLHRALLVARRAALPSAASPAAGRRGASSPASLPVAVPVRTVRQRLAPSRTRSRCCRWWWLQDTVIHSRPAAVVGARRRSRRRGGFVFVPRRFALVLPALVLALYFVVASGRRRERPARHPPRVGRRALRRDPRAAPRLDRPRRRARRADVGVPLATTPARHVHRSGTNEFFNRSVGTRLHRRRARRRAAACPRRRSRAAPTAPLVTATRRRAAVRATPTRTSTSPASRSRRDAADRARALPRRRAARRADARHRALSADTWAGPTVTYTPLQLHRRHLRRTARQRRAPLRQRASR